MKSNNYHRMLPVILSVLVSCYQPSEKVADQDTFSPVSQEELIKRGKYLTTIVGCNDCHSPKVMTPHGPEPDTTRLFSGHPQGDALSPIAQDRDWILFSNDFTATVGPWGVSYAANLTPDDTGIGNWKFEQFKKAIREGKYKGLDGTRPLLPPMPWQMYRSMTDQDLRAIFTYLKSLRPVNNLVPQPVPPSEVQLISMTKTK